jgi:hypothetical protein
MVRHDTPSHHSIAVLIEVLDRAVYDRGDFGFVEQATAQLDRGIIIAQEEVWIIESVSVLCLAGGSGSG